MQRATMQTSQPKKHYNKASALERLLISLPMQDRFSDTNRRLNRVHFIYHILMELNINNYSGYAGG